MLPIEKNARTLCRALAQHFPSGATSDELRLQFEKDTFLARPAFYEAFRYAKEQRWFVFRLENDRLVYVADPQAVQLEELPDEVEDLCDWSSNANGVAVANLAQIVSDSTASTRQRLRAAAALLGYKVADAGVLELTTGFLESLCANVEIATDHRIAAGELLRKHEAPRVMSEIVRPAYREDGSGSEAERVEAWRSYLLKQRKWKLVMDSQAGSLEPDAPYRLPAGWCDDLNADDFVAPQSGWPPWS